uniref:SERTA domain-containing protein n=1 Tax=Parascaris univalens TaxID=6257 RepID=A0A914ZJY2_PARUN
MSNTSSDVDEIIENEVCNRLIRLSCAKMVNSKHERGGAKLHRNLLILHLLRRARNEQKRSTPSSPDDLDSSSELCSGSADTTESAQSSVSGDAKDVGVDQFGKETDHLLDLSCSSHADITAGNDPIELHVRDDDEVDYSTLSLEPLLLPFGTDAVEAEELSDMSSDDDDEADGHQLAPQRRRKRKTSSPRVQPPCTAKKCLCERASPDRSYLGVQLRSVGCCRSVHVRSQPNPLLPQTPDQLVPSIMRIACNPLIC